MDLETGTDGSAACDAMDLNPCDQGAFCQLLQMYQNRIYAVALGIVRNPEDARDVCQEAFLKAYRSLGTFQKTARFYTWLYRIVINTALDHLRTRHRREQPLDEQQPDTGDDLLAERLPFDPARAFADKELRKHILDALDTLPAPHRVVLVLREVEGLSYAEIASIVGCPIGTVMSRLFHARKKMQELLISAGFGHAVAA